MLKVASSSLDWALRHVRRLGDTDTLPVPFEYEAIEYDWDRCREELARVDITQWPVRPHRSLLAPKGPHAFRQITQLDPLDFLLYAATVYEIAEELEASRIPASDEIVFSARVELTEDGGLYRREFGYASFLRKAGEVLEREPRFAFVATTDIADFYPRIYHHRLEQSLQAGTSRGDHVRAIMHLLAGWNTSESHGIPIGSAPTRLLAEALLSDTDQALLARNITFVRFVDDYRIFAHSYEEAYRHLGFLAEQLFGSLGLTLQAQKTSILSRESFAERFLKTSSDLEVESLNKSFERLVDDLGLSNPYEFISYDDLTDEQKETVDSLNLVGIFNDVMASETPDLRLVRFVLRRLTQLGNPEIADAVLAEIKRLYPIYPDVVNYVIDSDPRPPHQRRESAQSLLRLISNSILSELEFFKVWTLDSFVHSSDWNVGAEFARMIADAHDQFTRRKVILALGRHGQRFFFQPRWRTVFDEPHWPRRAVLAGASCLPGDAYKHWHKSIRSRLDLLERAVVRWAEAHPFA